MGTISVAASKLCTFLHHPNTPKGNLKVHGPIEDVKIKLQWLLVHNEFFYTTTISLGRSEREIREGFTRHG